MVHVVVLGAGPEGDEVVETPGELVAAVGVDGLEEAKDDPDVHGHDVEVLGVGAPEDGAADGAKTEDHDFDRGGVFSGHTEGCGVLVVDLVDAPVERAPVEGAVGEVVPGVFHDEEDGDLVGHGPDGGEGHGSLEAKVLSHRMEQPVVSCQLMKLPVTRGCYRPDLGEFDGEVTEEDESGAVPLLLDGRDFVLHGVSIQDAEI